MSENRMEIIWGTRLLDEGFTSIPNILIRNYRKLGIEHGEWGLICTLLTYKHDNRDPYPSRKSLADHLCCSEKQITKWTVSLKKKKFLRTGQRVNVKSRQWDTSVYNFKPLLDACLRLIGDKPLPDIESDYDVIWDEEENEPLVPQVAADSEPEVATDLEPEVATKKKKTKKKKENKNSQLVIKSEAIQQTISKSKKLTDRRVDIEDTYLAVKDSTGYSDALFISTLQKSARARINVPFGQYLLKAMINNMSEVTTDKSLKKKSANDLPVWIVNQQVVATSEELSDEQRQQATELLRALGELN